MPREGLADLVKDWQEGFVTVDGIEAHYLEAGSGDPLLLIHGGLAVSCAELNYGPVMAPLSKHFRVIALDVVGFGETTAPGPDYFPASAQGDFIIAFLETLDIRAHVGGNSHGGWLSQYVAHQAPERVEKLIIINSLNGTHPIPPAPEGLNYIVGPQGYHPHRKPTAEGIRADLQRFYVDQRIVTEARVQRSLEIATRNYSYAKARAEARHSSIDDFNEDLSYRGKHISEYAGEFNRDVLLTWSRENRGTTPAEAISYLNRLKQGEMHVFLDAGHHVMVEHPQRWSEVVVDFLRAS